MGIKLYKKYAFLVFLFSIGASNANSSNENNDQNIFDSIDLLLNGSQAVLTHEEIEQINLEPETNFAYIPVDVKEIVSFLVKYGPYSQIKTETIELDVILKKKKIAPYILVLRSIQNLIDILIKFKDLLPLEETYQTFFKRLETYKQELINGDAKAITNTKIYRQLESRKVLSNLVVRDCLRVGNLIVCNAR